MRRINLDDVVRFAIDEATDRCVGSDTFAINKCITAIQAMSRCERDCVAKRRGKFDCGRPEHGRNRWRLRCQDLRQDMCSTRTFASQIDRDTSSSVSFGGRQFNRIGVDDDHVIRTAAANQTRDICTTSVTVLDCIASGKTVCGRRDLISADIDSRCRIDGLDDRCSSSCNEFFQAVAGACTCSSQCDRLVIQRIILRGSELDSIGIDHNNVILGIAYQTGDISTCAMAVDNNIAGLITVRRSKSDRAVSRGHDSRWINGFDTGQQRAGLQRFVWIIEACEYRNRTVGAYRRTINVSGDACSSCSIAARNAH